MNSGVPRASGRRTVIVVDLEDEDDALRMAQRLADATGRSGRIRDEHLMEVAVVPAPTRN